MLVAMAFLRRHVRLLFVAAVAPTPLVAPLTTSCTARILEDAAAPPACASDDDCGAGSTCVEDVCADADADPVPREATVVGPGGGTVYGPDGVSLTIDPGALAASTAFTITTTTATLEYANFTPTLRLYTIDPTTEFSDAVVGGARIHVPAVEAGAADGALTLFLRPTPPGPVWDPIEDDDGDGAFVLRHTGTFGIGVAAAEAP